MFIYNLYQNRIHDWTNVTLSSLTWPAISSRWEKVERNDTFGTGRYKTDRFVFDHYGGTILPGETYKAAVLYKSFETGYYSQDWLLKTQPVLEAGAKVILRMWGVSQQYDPYSLARENIDQVRSISRRRMSTRICEKQKWRRKCSFVCWFITADTAFLSSRLAFEMLILHIVYVFPRLY